MEIKTCTVCKNEKHINKFYKNYSQRKDCNTKRGLKRYYDNKDKISIQRKICFEKKDELLQKQNDYRKKETQILKKYLYRILNYKID